MYTCITLTVVYIETTSKFVVEGGRSTVDVEAINDQQSMQRRSTPLILGGGADQLSTWRGSTANFHFYCEKMIASVDPEGD